MSFRSLMLANLLGGLFFSYNSYVFAVETCLEALSKASDTPAKVATRAQKQEVKQEVTKPSPKVQTATSAAPLAVNAAGVPIVPIHKVQIKLSDLMATGSNNPILAHPALVLNSAQKYFQLLRLKPPKIVKDPVFRVNDVRVFPVFTDDLDLQVGRSIIGQYNPLEVAVDHISSSARGEKSGKFFAAVGPSGTGKTELFYILNATRAKLGQINPHFYEFSFVWKNLDKIPALKGLVPTFGGKAAFNEIRPDMPRSPFTLLRPDMQEEAMAGIRSELEAFLGFSVFEWTDPTPKDAAILEQIFIHKEKEIASGAKTIDEITPTRYLKILEDFVRIVPRLKSNEKDSIIRFLGPNPNFAKLFVDQNPMRALVYPNTSPLAWEYTGKVLQQDGRALIFDEAPRNEKEVLDVFLELAQNDIAEADGPAVELDVMTMTTGNDESIVSARESGDLNAYMDRSNIVPMRLNLHPHEISKIAILMAGTKNFMMRSLTKENAKLKPLDINEAYPLPNFEGMLEGVYRRHALYYKTGVNSDPILISPHTLEMLGLTAAATRLVINPAVFKGFKGEFEKIGAQHHYFLRPIDRLKLILGLDNVNMAVRAEIAKFSQLAKEGEKGISSRDVQSWLKASLDLAIQQGFSVLTPEILDTIFNKLIDQGTIEVKNNNIREDWKRRYRSVKINMILPALHRDIEEIVAGHGQRALRLYQTIVSELIALSEDSAAEVWHRDDQRAPQIINKTRLEAIKVKYKQLHGREFTPGFLMAHFSKAGRQESNRELLSAVEAYITDNELDIADTAKEVIAYYSGDSVSPEIEKNVSAIEGRLSSYGYDENSFRAALNYWHILQSEKTRGPGNRNLGR